MENLTNREKELCAVMFKNTEIWLTAAEVAKELGLSDRTVEQYLSNIYKKMGINTKEQLYNMWSGNPQKGYDFRETLIDNILEKAKGTYDVSTDKEFIFAAGLVYGFLKAVWMAHMPSDSVFKNIEDLLRKECTEKNIKTIVKKAYFAVADKLLLEIKIEPIMAGILVYEIEKDMPNDADNIFYAGVLSYYKFVQKLKEID